MKPLRLLLGFLVAGPAGLLAQTPPPATVSVETAERLTDAQLEELLGPIALYPDALIALILPASTVPADIVLAARQLRDSPGDRSQIEHRAWDESVKALTSYPEVLQWLDENLAWTKQVGEAFLAQPAEVMQALQRLRARAQAAGTLLDTPQQRIVREPDVIRIVPAQPDVIYVPRYEPDVVYVSQPTYYAGPFLHFGVGAAVGSWLAYDCDWRRHKIWTSPRHRPWTQPDWRRPIVPIVHHRPPPPQVREWCPPAHAQRSYSARSYRPSIARPTPFGRSYSGHRDHGYRNGGYQRDTSRFQPPTMGPRSPHPTGAAAANRSLSVPRPPSENRSLSLPGQVSRPALAVPHHVTGRPHQPSPAFRGATMGPQPTAPHRSHSFTTPSNPALAPRVSPAAQAAANRQRLAPIASPRPSGHFSPPHHSARVNPPAAAPVMGPQPAPAAQPAPPAATSGNRELSAPRTHPRGGGERSGGFRDGSGGYRGGSGRHRS